MSDQGAPPQQQRPEDGWWQAVYAGPADTLPETPPGTADTATVDDRFESAVGLIGPPRPPADGASAAPRPHPEADAGARSGRSARAAEAWSDPAAGAADPVPPAPPAPTADEPADTASSAGGETRVPRPWVPTADTPADPRWPVTPAHPEPDPVPGSPDASHAGRWAGAPDGPQLDKASAGAAAAPAAVVPEAPVDPADGDTSAVPRVAPPSELLRSRVEEAVPHVGERPPTYGPEPTAMPAADPERLAAAVADTVLDGAQYGNAVLRAASVRGDSARFRGEPRRDALLTVRFGSGEDGLLLAVLAAPAREAEAHWGSAAAAEAVRQLAGAVGRSRAELAADLRAGARDRLRYGLQRLATQAAVVLRSGHPESPDAEQASLHCLMVSLDPAASHRAAFGTGPGGLYLLRSGHWIDAYGARLLHHPDGQPALTAESAQVPRPFRFRLVPATPGDILLLCTPGLATPVSEEPAVAHFLSSHWAHPHPPGTVDFLRQVQVRAKGYADDRTAAALWTE
ncbi:protein phosphatase 2C domain-containing protein [Kitasatospora paracochleata]|uniref:Protein phosphatase 2C-like protein n=1 Tax=Kitasatospora paracochleata TaxID=58354 RepID=A0ABT1J532_9ACTN|nr:protein phosphatase 2C domain-containing protein [Kitasatospora paracochleata]MCP2312542.1 hypothetical protein [Kitasatospora paracochleata]